MTVLFRGLMGVGLLLAGIVAGRSTGRPGEQTPPPAAAPREATEGPPPRRLEATVYVPLCDNQGQPFGEGEWKTALAALVSRFRGATLGPPQEGCWLAADGRLVR